ncbi:MAG: tRNA 2-thiocytidine(32) synthetase TtcA [Kiritimatiellales bacterium]|nr:tRNA 2-thiocytidine(32) synthetase TtcA [Kiritimatiellota bacterium]MBL7016646.1 tRNA 2-thiocytidine(32) synthetase TtcA [Kiritimatiellales bacterium]
MKKRTDPLLELGRLAGKAIVDFKMIQDGDRLLVGISGGVDSMMLMHVLTRFQKRAPISFELFAVTLDEGFDGIDHAPLAEYAEQQGWDLKIIKTPIAQLIVEKESTDHPCGLCARLRRGFIHGHADELNCNKLVLGHHRDDLCVSLLMSLFRGKGIKTMSPNIAADSGTKRLIRPLCYAPKKLIEESAGAFDFPNIGNCDYSEQLDQDGDRATLERLFHTLEETFPNIGKSMLHSMGDLRPETLLDKRFLDHLKSIGED